MYEARQNKEKVSRRIDGDDGGTRQRVKIEDWRRNSKMHNPLSVNQILFSNKNSNVHNKKADKYTLNTIQCITNIYWDKVQPYQYIDKNGNPTTISFGQNMRALLDANDPRQGSAPGGGPQADARNDAMLNNGGGKMILGHLLNSNLGGLGLSFNLYPISAIANAEHSASVETYVKNEVMRNVGKTGDPTRNNIHVEYHVSVIPTTGVGYGGSRHISSVSPDATITCHWRSFRYGGWLPWNTKTITSIAGDDYLPITGNWNELGAGQRIANLWGTGNVNPNHINITALNTPINMGGVFFNNIIQQNNGIVIGLLV